MRVMWMITCACCVAWTSADLQAKELSPRDIYEQASPAVVMVMGHSDGGKTGSGGTGSIIRADGLVLTNAHVVVEERTGKPYPWLSVFLKPPRVTGDSRMDLARMLRAKVVAFSSPLDLAILKLEEPPAPLPVVAFSESTQGRIGDRVVAIGHPEQGGLWTLTTGVISAEMDNFNGVKGKHVFQTETGLNRGNSGGPLLDSEGRMIAVNTAIARVATDGLPITSISFSLKSSVAAQWLRDQGFTGSRAGTTKVPSAQTNAAAGLQAKPFSQPETTTAQPPNTRAPVAPPTSMKPRRSAEPVSPHPYDLDALITDRARAEADLEGMMSEMRGGMKGR
ncbi:MAG TPA: trypsin-like peptidase domain-containing protein [Nitrospira sp.]|nr:trypsin-like peptidase domain-containing protein [Nitrospira sp.]